MLTKNNRNAEKVLQYIRNNPGATGPEIHQQFQSKIRKKTISGTLSRLRVMGLITNDGSRGPRTHWYPVIFDTPEFEYTEQARTIFHRLENILPSERERWLSLYLQNLLRKD